MERDFKESIWTAGAANYPGETLVCPTIRSCRRLIRILAALSLIISFVLGGCAKVESPTNSPPTVIRFRGGGFWFRDLEKKFADFSTKKITIKRLSDLDWSASEQYRQTVLVLSSIYDAGASKDQAGADEYGTLHDEVDVMITDPSWVPEFARNGWLTPFDESTAEILREAGVDPIRVAGKNDSANAPPIYGIPITRGADLIFYWKSSFGGDVERARQEWESSITSGRSLGGGLLTDGQDFYRFFCGLIWSIEPSWPYDSSGKLVVDTPGTRQILTFLMRSTQIERVEPTSSRSEQFSRQRKCFSLFAGCADNAMQAPPSRSGVANANRACWLLSTGAQRMLISARSQLLDALGDIGVLPLTAAIKKPGYSLAGGKCLIMPRRLTSTNKNVAGAIPHLVEYLLSAPGQRDLCLDQFEIPARREVLTKPMITAEEVATVLTKWQQPTSVDKKHISQQSDQVLQLLRDIEKALTDSSKMIIVQERPLSRYEAFAVNQMLCELLARHNNPPGESPVDEKARVDNALARLQAILETEHRFYSPAVPLHSSAGSAP